MKGVLQGFSINQGDSVKVGIEQTMGLYQLLNYVKNNYTFAKFVIELVVL